MGLYFHSFIIWEAAFLSTVASMRLETDFTTRGSRQGRTRQASKIKSITRLKVLNPPKVENHPSTNSPGVPTFPGLDWDVGDFSHSVCDFFYDLSFIIYL
jgi:hypothetical protein